MQGPDVEVGHHGTDHAELAHHLPSPDLPPAETEGLLAQVTKKTHQDAFNNILRVWGRESAALSNANIPSMMDVLT